MKLKQTKQRLQRNETKRRKHSTGDSSINFFFFSETNTVAKKTREKHINFTIQYILILWWTMLPTAPNRTTYFRSKWKWSTRRTFLKCHYRNSFTCPIKNKKSWNIIWRTQMIILPFLWLENNFSPFLLLVISMQPILALWFEFYNKLTVFGLSLCLHTLFRSRRTHTYKQCKYNIPIAAVIELEQQNSLCCTIFKCTNVEIISFIAFHLISFHFHHFIFRIVLNK